MLTSDVERSHTLQKIICNAALSLINNLRNDTVSNRAYSIEWWNNNVRTEKDVEADDRSHI